MNKFESSQPWHKLFVAGSSELPMAARDSDALVHTIGAIAGSGLVLCLFEALKHKLFPNLGTLSSLIATILVVTLVATTMSGFSIARLIAEKRRSQAVLRQSEEQYRLLFESNSVPMWVYDRKTLRFLSVNQAAIEQYGYSKEEFLTKKIADIRPAEDVPDLLNEVAKQTRGIHHSGIWRHRRKNGSVLSVEIVSHDLTFDGTAASLVAAYDVTERKRAEDSVRQAEENYRGIFENSVVGIFQSAPDGRFISVNRALANMHGYGSPQELLATIAREGPKLMVDPNGMAELAKAAEEHGAVRGAELEIYCKDGSRRWVRLNLRIIRDIAGKVVLREGTVEDITEHKAAQERVQFLAYHDALTELPHRILLRTAWKWPWQTHAAETKRLPCCLSISTVSNPSTTPSATRLGTLCSRTLPGG